MDIDVAHAIAPPCAGSGIRRALRAAQAVDTPYRHWLLRDVLPPVLSRPLAELPFEPAAITDTGGKRETHNAQRRFINDAARADFPACAVLAEAFQDEATVGLLSDITGTDLTGSYLRIEYCMDTGGFWLEPHTDIGAKLFTMLVYLSDGADAANWGTDIMAPDGTVLGRAPADFNRGLMFIPGPDTWHGFTPRAITGVRRSLIVNYVKPEWRSRHELAFPHEAVVAA